MAKIKKVFASQINTLSNTIHVHAIFAPFCQLHRVKYFIRRMTKLVNTVLIVIPYITHHKKTFSTEKDDLQHNR